MFLKQSSISQSIFDLSTVYRNTAAKLKTLYSQLNQVQYVDGEIHEKGSSCGTVSYMYISLETIFAVTVLNIKPALL